MYKFQFQIVFSVLFLALIINSACTKVEKGPQGDPGAAGKSPKVETEQVQVVSTMWTTTDSLYWETNILSTKITQSIIDQGTVNVYVLKNNLWCALPFLEEDLYTVFGYQPGKVLLRRGDSHHLLPEKPHTEIYKIVTVSTS